MLFHSLGPRKYLIAFTLHALLQAHSAHTTWHPHLPNLTSNDLSIPSVHMMFIPISYLFDKKQKQEATCTTFPFFFSPCYLNFLTLYLFASFFFFSYFCIHIDLFISFSFHSGANFQSGSFFFLSSIIISIFFALHFFFIPLSCILHFAFQIFFYHQAGTPLPTITHLPFFPLLFSYICRVNHYYY